MRVCECVYECECVCVGESVCERECVYETTQARQGVEVTVSPHLLLFNSQLVIPGPGRVVVGQ